MLRLSLRAFFFIALAIGLAACAARPRPVEDIPRAVEIKAVVVTAAADVAPALMRNTQTQLRKAIDNTVRPVPMPRAVMQVHIAEVARGRAYDGVTAQASLTVVLADIDSGIAILNRPYVVPAFAFNQRSLNNALVEAIVARLRVDFGLSQPVLRELPQRRERLSTRMQTEEPALVKHEEVAPVVVPLKAVKRIGTDEDPVLNSRTKLTVEDKPAKAVVLPDAKVRTDDAAAPENALESGAKAKVTIQPKVAVQPKDVEAEPAGNEPCVETMDKKC
jgi:hypothetical protein